MEMTVTSVTTVTRGRRVQPLADTAVAAPRAPRAVYRGPHSQRVLLPGEVLDPPLTREELTGHVIIGHGLLGAGLPDLLASVDMPLSELADHVHDIEVLARLTDPPAGEQAAHLALERYSLPALARNHGHPWTRDPLTQRLTLRLLAQDYPLTPYGKREMKVLTITPQITRNGFRGDKQRLDELWEQEQQRTQEAIEHLALQGMPIHNFDGSISDSPTLTEAGRAFIAQYLNDSGVPLPTKESKQPDLSKKVLEQIIQVHPDPAVVEFARTVLDARSSGILSQVQERMKNGRVHPRIEALQATGRFSVTEPALTVLPKDEHRSVFIPDEGHLLITADLRQIDSRAGAVLSQDPAYLENFAPGRDHHREVAMTLFGDDSAPNRDRAKRINHAISYGAGAALIAQVAGISREEAQEHIDRLARAYPRYAAWKRDIIDRAKAGDLLDNGHGRVVATDPARIHTTAVARVVQSCARDLFAESLLRCDAAGLTPYMRLLIHDEIVFSVPADEAEHYRHVIKDCMTFTWKPEHAEQAVNIECEVRRPVSNWAEASRMD